MHVRNSFLPALSLILLLPGCVEPAGRVRPESARPAAADAGADRPASPAAPPPGASADRPRVPPSGWLSYQPGPDGRIETPVAGLSLEIAPRLFDKPSAGGRTLPYWVFPADATGDRAPRPVTLILAGMHGGEISPAVLGFRLVAWLEQNPEAIRAGTIVVAPLVDPDGFHAKRRTNDHRVDLNRNYPAKNFKPSRGHGSKPACETETQFVLRLMELFPPTAIVSIHAPLACVNYDGPADDLARTMSAACGLPVRRSVGYPTPGSFGTWAGIDRGLPTITLELPGRSPDRTNNDKYIKSILAAHEWNLRHSRRFAEIDLE